MCKSCGFIIVKNVEVLGFFVNSLCINIIRCVFSIFFTHTTHKLLPIPTGLFTDYRHTFSLYSTSITIETN